MNNKDQLESKVKGAGGRIERPAGEWAEEKDKEKEVRRIGKNLGRRATDKKANQDWPSHNRHPVP